MSRKRYFTLAEANAQVSVLQRVFIGVLQIRSQLKVLYERLDAAGFAPRQDEADTLPDDAPSDILRDRAKFYGLVEALREQVEEIHATGAQIKDIETGLVDWPARNANREILLCWRFGEREIGFWHDADTGFAGRRPVSELDDLTR
jgi:hypothetical protein